jgi:hypothetical protein
MSRYAENTSVSAEQSRGEIERTLQRYGADGFMYGWDGPRALIMFRARGRHIKFVMDLPDQHEPRFTHTEAKRQKRSPDAALKAWEQSCRQRWRALALCIKAKLEAVEAGITEFENEFMANIVLPDGQMVSDFMRPQIALAYDSGSMPTLLPDYSGGG